MRSTRKPTRRRPLITAAGYLWPRFHELALYHPEVSRRKAEKQLFQTNEIGVLYSSKPEMLEWFKKFVRFMVKNTGTGWTTEIWQEEPGGWRLGQVRNFSPSG